MTSQYTGGTRPSGQPWAKAKTKPGSREAAAQARKVVLNGLEEGLTVEEACKAAGRGLDFYKRSREAYPEFKEEASAIIARRRGIEKTTPVPDFPEFCEEYLGMRLFSHQLQWFDLLEGREPRDLHPSQTYIPGTQQNIVVNTPPGFAKSTTITVAYVTWRILRDMNTKVIIVSKKQNFAANFLYAIKAILTSSRYRKLQTAWAPLEGFEKSAAEWSATQIRLRDEESDFEKDPTVQVLGIQGQIYGSRADLIVVDDAVVLDNVNQWEQQLRWIRQEVDSRLYSSSSKVLVVGTRVAPVDLYSALLDENNYDGEQSPWTYLTQPAILEDSEDPEQVVTLWPRSNVPPRTQPGQEVQPDPDGLYPKWDHTALMQRRRKLDAHTWNLVWMQRQVSETSIFHREAVLGCMQRTRNPGLMKAGLPGHRERGMSGLYVVAGLDPAAVNYTAAVALAVDRHTGHRWVLDVHNQSGMTPDAMRRLIYDWTETLGVQEWRVEENAFQKFLTLDREVNQWLAMRGVVLQGHTTGRNKADPELGVAAMASLFRGWEDKGNLISLPTHNTSWGVRALVDQLVTWFPGTKAPSDTVMALWFAELRAREIAGQEGSADFVESSWLSPHQMDTREVIDLYDFEGALSG